MTGNITPYVSEIATQHADKPNFTAMVAATAQPLADLISLYQTYPALYDIDSAVGSQLDVIGQWIGLNRYLEQTITGVFFSFDTPNLGFDQGVWQGPYDPATGLSRLPDDFYRILLRAKILNNHWDGTKETAYSLTSVIFNGTGYQLFIEDKGDMSMNLGLIETGAPSPLLVALFNSGKFNLKPAGIKINSYITQSIAGPIFAFDLNNTYFAGFDTGAWATLG